MVVQDSRQHLFHRNLGFSRMSPDMNNNIVRERISLLGRTHRINSVAEKMAPKSRESFNNAFLLVVFIAFVCSLQYYHTPNTNQYSTTARQNHQKFIVALAETSVTPRTNLKKH